MADMDFTPVQDLLGREVCFLDFAFEASFEKYKHSFNDDNFRHELYLDRFRFGRVCGCAIDLQDAGQLVFHILIDDIFYTLSHLEFLFVSTNSSIISPPG